MFAFEKGVRVKPKCVTHGARVMAAGSLGVRPTFETEGELLVEAYLIDFEGDLYGRTLRVAFLERLRDEIRFDSVEDLVEQMRRDAERARAISSAVLERG